MSKSISICSSAQHLYGNTLPDLVRTALESENAFLGSDSIIGSTAHAVYTYRETDAQHALMKQSTRGHMKKMRRRYGKRSKHANRGITNYVYEQDR